MEEVVKGRIIAIPITWTDVILTDDEGYGITNESELPLVFNEEKGVLRIVGISSKLGQVLSVKRISDNEELPYAPMYELKKLFLECESPLNRTEKLLIPIIRHEDYQCIFDRKLLNIDGYFKINKILDEYDFVWFPKENILNGQSTK